MTDFSRSWSALARMAAHPKTILRFGMAIHDASAFPKAELAVNILRSIQFQPSIVLVLHHPTFDTKL